MRQVLFVSTHDAARSQMAEAFFTRYAPVGLRAISAGPEPADRIAPEIVEAMAEVGIDIWARRPKELTLEMQLGADRAVTLGDVAGCAYVPAVVEEWDIPDPAGLSTVEIRAIRDEIGGRVDDLVTFRAEKIRCEEPVLRWRLASLLPDLIGEFGGLREPHEIRSCVDAVLADYRDVTRTGDVLEPARRRLGACLRTEGCAELAGVG